MTLTERQVGHVTVLALKGRLVLDAGDDVLRQRVRALVNAGRLKILLDLRDVTYIDSCGIGVLVEKFVSVRSRGGDIRLVHLTARSRHLMAITRLLTVFPIFDTEAEALASFASEPSA
ncbi:hypothetical protein BH24ACI5_BH24ACI5_19080 [soil metagenome]